MALTIREALQDSLRRTNHLLAPARNLAGTHSFILTADLQA